MLQWEGHLVPSFHGVQRGSVHVQAYGPLDGCNFVITLRASDPQEGTTGRLLVTLADLIARNFAGTCLTGNQIVEGKEWLGWHIPDGLGTARDGSADGLSLTN
jgi:hypothetical protein